MSINLTKLNARLIIVIFILVLILIDGLIYFNAREEASIINDNNISDTIDTTYTDIVNNVRKINGADPKTWKTYSNQEFGFGLKYPNYYEIMIPTLSQSEKERQKIEAYILFIYDEFASQITIAIHNKSIKEVASEISDSDKKDSKNINIAGKTAEKINITRDGKIWSVVFFEKDKKTFTIMSEDSQVFDKFLGTLIFTK